MSSDKSYVVLLLGSKPFDVMQLKYTFNGNNFKVITAESGAKALEMAQSELFDIVVVDGVLEDIDIAVLCRGIKENPKISKTPIVLLSTEEEVDYRVKALNAGADGYLMKPIQTDLMMAQLREAVEQSTQTDTEYKKELNKTTRMQLIVLTSCKGGTGVSTITANLGYLLTAVHRRRTLLINAAGHTDHIAPLLKASVMPGTSFADFCIKAIKSEREFLTTSITKINERLGVMSLLDKKNDISSINVQYLDWAIEIALKEFDFILVDSKVDKIDAVSLCLMKKANEINVVSTYDPLAINYTKSYINSLIDSGIEQNKIKLIVNRADCEIGNLDPDAVQDRHRYPIFCTLPNNWHACIEAIEKSKTVIQNSPKSNFSLALNELAEYYVGKN